MSKLEHLIKELCQNGVEYKKLGEIVTDIFRGSGITREQITIEGTPCVRYGEIYTTYGIWFNDCVSHTDEKVLQSKKYFEHGDILFAITGESVEDIAKSTAYVGNEKCLAGGDIVVLKHNQNPKYLSYALSTVDAQTQKSKGKVKSKVVHSSVPAIKDIIIPLPPLEIQEEIVRILDNFTELTAELTARKKQYEYYRDMMLDFGDNVEWKTLGEIATIVRGGNFQKKDFIENGLPCIHYGQMYTHYGAYATKTLSFVSSSTFNKSKIANKNDIVMAVTSENIKDICKCVAWLGNENIAVSGHTAIIKHNQNAKFLSYYFQTQNFFTQKKKLAHGTKVIEITPNDLNKIKIPVPPIEKQKKIVKILDRFDKLCNDISEGLPAEIEARRKQYEYYRDKLLTFNIKE